MDRLANKTRVSRFLFSLKNDWNHLDKWLIFQIAILISLGKNRTCILDYRAFYT